MDRCRTGQALALLLLGLGLTANLAGKAGAQAQPSNQVTLEARRSQLREFIQQQQVSLRTQMQCISTARSLDEFDRCQRGMPRTGASMHGWGMGGWGCQPW